MDILPYDKANAQSIEAYARGLIGYSFQDILNNEIGISNRSLPNNKYDDLKRKGGLGNLVEECYFGYKANSNPEPDFEEAGVELKVTPYEETKKGEKRAGERLVLSMIDYNNPIEASFFDSHVWKKCRLILLIYYLRNKALESNLLYRIHYVSLFTPTETDLAIIENDYQYIYNKVSSGKAEELSEADTFYLGACTKGATAESSIVLQYYPPHTPAKKRAYCFKMSYMTYVLNNYVIPQSPKQESIVKSREDLKNKSFSQLIIDRINSHTGKTDIQLCKMFDREYNNNKAQWTDLAYRMLGIKSNRAEEFRKANITVKVIRLEESGKMKECMSLPPFKYKELILEEWENSTLHNYFAETKFLLVVFKHNGTSYTLKGCQLWNMSAADLNSTVMNGWNKVVNTIKSGVSFTIKNSKSGVVVENNLPKKKDNKIIHVRPHATKRYFEFSDGTIIGNGTRADANQLPDGTWMPHYSFWLNNDYILNQLGDYVK